jgi:hypothetical protein
MPSAANPIYRTQKARPARLVRAGLRCDVLVGGSPARGTQSSAAQLVPNWSGAAEADLRDAKLFGCEPDAKSPRRDLPAARAS